MKSKIIDKDSALYRVLVAVFVPLILISGCIYLYFFGSPLPCFTYQIFHIYCPGCGTGRAVFDLVHFRFAEAFGHNPFAIISLPYIAYETTALFIRFVFRTKKPRSINVNRIAILIATVLIVAFWIVRNIPIMPFSLLAP